MVVAEGGGGGEKCKIHRLQSRIFDSGGVAPAKNSFTWSEKKSLLL